MTKRQKLVAYSIDFSEPRQVSDHSVKDPARFALANLLMVAGRMMENDDFELVSPSKLTLELETDKWDQCLVLTIERMPDDD